MKTLAPAGVLAAAILLSACGGSAATALPPSNFPTTQNLPMLTINNRVINLNDKGSGYKYAKLSLDVLFADTTGQFGGAKGDALKKLEDSFNADNSATIAAFNDVLTTDVSQLSPQQLATPDGKETLRKQLIADFNSRLTGQNKVLYIDFTDFVMQ